MPESCDLLFQLSGPRGTVNRKSKVELVKVKGLEEVTCVWLH